MMYTEIVEYTCMLSIWNKFKKNFPSGMNGV